MIMCHHALSYRRMKARGAIFLSVELQCNLYQHTEGSYTGIHDETYYEIRANGNYDMRSLSLCMCIYIS